MFLITKNDFVNIHFFLLFDISDPRARGRTVLITFLSTTNIKLFSDDSDPRARGLTEPVLHVFW